MAIQSTIQVDLRYLKEADFGKTPTGAQSWQRQRFIGSTLSMSKDTFGSEERRPDRNISDFRHGPRRIGGDLSGELSIGGWDDFIEAALGGTWADELSHDEATMVSCTGVASSGSTLGTFTIAPTDSAANGWVAAGYRVGDVVRFTNLSVAGNNNKNFQIMKMTPTAISVLPSPTANATDSDFEVKRVGKKVMVGGVQRSFSIEQAYGDISQYQRFKGCRINTLGISLPPSGVVGVTCGVVGQDQDAISGTAITSQSLLERPTGTVLAALNGALVIDETQVAVVTGLDINVNNNISGEPAVGSNKVPELFYGRCEVTGTMTVFLEDATFINYFINETVAPLAFLIQVPNDASKFLNFVMPRVKFGGADVNVTGEGGVTLSMPYQSILGTGTGVDATSLAVQRSNNT